MLNSVSGESHQPRFPSPMKDPDQQMWGYTQPEDLTLQQAAMCIVAASTFAAIATRPISNFHRFSFMSDLPGHTVGVGSGLGKRRHVLDVLFGTSWWKQSPGRKDVDPVIVAGGSFMTMFSSYWFSYHYLLNGTNTRIFESPAEKALHYNKQVLTLAGITDRALIDQLLPKSVASSLMANATEKKVYDPSFAGQGGKGKDREVIEREATERQHQLMRQLRSQLGPDAATTLHTSEVEGHNNSTSTATTSTSSPSSPGWFAKLLGKKQQQQQHSEVIDVDRLSAEGGATRTDIAARSADWMDSLPSAESLLKSAVDRERSQYELDQRLTATDAASLAMRPGGLSGGFSLVSSGSWRTVGYSLPEYNLLTNWPLNGFLAGIASAVCLTAVRQPYDVLLATAEHPGPGGRNFTGPMDVLMTMVREKPAMLKGLYRGGYTSLLASSVQFSLLFGIYNAFKYDIAVSGSDLQMYALCHVSAFTGYTMQYPIHAVRQSLHTINQELIAKSVRVDPKRLKVSLWSHFLEIKSRHGITKVYDGFFRFKPLFITMPAAIALFTFDKTTRWMQESSYTHTTKPNAYGQNMFRGFMPLN